MTTDSRPNILVFFTDQQRWDTCGCYGTNPMGLTPALDELAARGTRLAYSFTVQPVCGPARACFQTGLYGTQHGVWRNGIPLATTHRTLAHRLGEAGYWTGYIGKWHLASAEPVRPAERGGYADLWLGANMLEFTSHPYDLHMFDGGGADYRRPGYRVDAETDAVIQAIRDRGAAVGSGRDPRPFFLFVSYLEPHHQNDMDRYVAPDGYAERYRDFYVPPDLQGLTGDWQEQLPDYYGICRRLDENLARVNQTLVELGMADDTVVLFTSDHGSHFKTRPGEYKRSCHEGSIRVPTVFAGPGFDRSAVVERSVTILDWCATLLDAAGVGVPPEIEGRSILPLLDGKVPDWSDEVFIQISESQVGRGLRTPQWKYGVTAPGLDGVQEYQSAVYREQYLYDLSNDPIERQNLAGSPDTRAIAEELAAALQRRMAAVGEPEAVIEG